MKRVSIAPRPDWVRIADRTGFRYHTPAHGAYWCEDAYFELSMRQVERDLRPAVTTVWDLCLEFADRASGDERILGSLGIPAEGWDAVRRSWRRHDPAICTRFDFAYDGSGPPKLHECNGDVPGLLFETAAFQWIWLQDAVARATVPDGVDQFNRIHDALVETFAGLPSAADQIHFAAAASNIEDQVWADYLRDCAHQAGRTTVALAIEDIGVDAQGRLRDMEGQPIGHVVKAYRWELLLREDFAAFVTRPEAPVAVEPPWKLMLSSKGLLVWLWRLFPGHPNLLPCWFGGDGGAPTDRCVVKPLLSNKGCNIRLVDSSLPGGEMSTPGPYGGEGHVVQALHRLPRFARPGGDSHATVTGWIIGDRAEGIGIVESDGPIITDETCRFVPHVVVG